MNKEDDKQKVATNFVHILEDHGEHLRNHLYQQWLKGEHCDLMIKFKNGEINVHSAVLFAVSPTLRELPKKKPIRYLSMPDMDLSDLDPLIKMAYTGVLCIDLQYAEGVAMAARRLGMKDICLAIRGYLDKFQENSTNGPVFVSTQKSSNQINDNSDTIPDFVKKNPKSLHNRRRVTIKTSKLNLAKKNLNRKDFKIKNGSKLKTLLKLDKPDKVGDSINNVEGFPDTAHAEDKYTTSSHDKYTTSSHDKYTTSSDDKYTTSSDDKYTTSSPDKYTTSSHDKYTTSSHDKYTTSSDDKYTTSSPDKCTTSSHDKYTTSSHNYIKKEDIDDDYSTTKTTSRKMCAGVKTVHCGSDSETEDYEDSTSGMEMLVDSDSDYKPPKSHEVLLGKTGNAIELTEIKLEGGEVAKPKLAFFEGRRPRSKRRRRNEQGQLKCPGCEAVFDADIDLQKHIQSEEAHLLFRCPECELSYIRKSNLTRHMRTSHSKEFHLKCRHCDSIANTEKELREHCKVKHDNLNPFECDEPDCSYKTYKYDFLRRHLQIHNINREFVCDKCGKTFSQHAGLASHRRTCYQLQEYLCDFCGQAFNHIQSMKSHRRTIHLGERPFMCSECGSRFTDHRNLKRHKRIHENSFPYGCEICGQKYRHSNSLKGHMKKHGDSYSGHVNHPGLQADDLTDGKIIADESLSFSDIYSQTFTAKSQELSDPSYPNKADLSFNRDAELSSQKYQNGSELSAQNSSDSDIQLNFNKDQQDLAEYPHNADSYDKESELPPHLYIPLYRVKSDANSQSEVADTGEYSVQNNGIGDLTDLCYSV